MILIDSNRELYLQIDTYLSAVLIILYVKIFLFSKKYRTISRTQRQRAACRACYLFSFLLSKYRVRYYLTVLYYKVISEIEQ